MNKIEEMQNLEKVCKPVAEYLRNNYDPHCTIIITDTQIKLVRDEIGIPVETDPEISVQEQSQKFIPEDSNGVCGDLTPCKCKEETAPEVPVQEQLKDNFSSQTGERINDTCPNCWMKSNKPYSCGYDNCPGIKLIYLEKLKS